MGIDFELVVLLYVVLLVSLVVHEASHALVALLGGDKTAYLGGQVTLNPIPHIQREPFGTVVLPLMVLFLSKGTMILGYAHAPFDPYWAHRYPRRAALMAAAGPASNFLLCAIAFLGLKILIGTDVAGAYPSTRESFLLITPYADSGWAYALVKILSAFLVLNLLLGIFNLLPVPPLDGAGIVEGLGPRGTAGFFAYVRSQPMLLIVGIVIAWQLIGVMFWPALDVVKEWLWT